MGIFKAEHQHKTASEDQLTSRIFGGLSIMDKRYVLIPFLLELTKDKQVSKLKELHEFLDQLSVTDINKIEVKLWNRFGDRYPDVYIDNISKYLVVVEVKENTRADPNQIVEQYCEANNYDKVILYFLLTKDREEPDAIRDAKTDLQTQGINANIYWRQWKQIWYWLKEISPMIKATDGNLLKDLKILLEDKGMADFTGISANWFDEEVANSLKKLNDLYTQLQYLVLSLREVKNGKTELDRLKLIEHPDGVFYSEVPKNLKPEDTNKYKVAPYFDVQYQDKEWNKKSELDAACIFVTAVPSESRLTVGFWNDKVPEEKWDEIQKKASDNGLAPKEIDLERGEYEIEVRYDLIGGTSTNKESQEIELKDIIEKIEIVRDFTRGVYGIKKTKSHKLSKKG